MSEPARQALTAHLLTLARSGSEPERAAAEQHLRDGLYAELRAIAGACLRDQRSGHTLQPTALVHEAWIRLGDHLSLGTSDRARLLALAATAMRTILVDHARAKSAAKRGGGRATVTLDTALEPRADADPADVVAIDDALRRLAERDPRQACIVEMRVFGGMTVDEAACALGVSPRTVDVDWRMARAWLSRALTGEDDEGRR